MCNATSLIAGFGLDPNWVTENGVGHYQELRRNGASLILGFCQKSGLDPNWVTENWVGQFQESRHNGTRLILGCGRKSGLDPNLVTQMWFAHLNLVTQMWFAHFQGIRRNGACMHQFSLHLPVSDVQLRPACWHGTLEPLECKTTSCCSINRICIMQLCNKIPHASGAIYKWNVWKGVSGIWLMATSCCINGRWDGGGQLIVALECDWWWTLECEANGKECTLECDWLCIIISTAVNWYGLSHKVIPLHLSKWIVSYHHVKMLACVSHSSQYGWS